MGSISIEGSEGAWTGLLVAEGQGEMPINSVEVDGNFVTIFSEIPEAGELIIEVEFDGDEFVGSWALGFDGGENRSVQFCFFAQEVGGQDRRAPMGLEPTGFVTSPAHSREPKIEVLPIELWCRRWAATSEYGSDAQKKDECVSNAKNREDKGKGGEMGKKGEKGEKSKGKKGKKK